VADFSEYIGKPTTRGTLVIERGPLSNFAKAVLDDSPVYRNAETAAAEQAERAYKVLVAHWQPRKPAETRPTA